MKASERLLESVRAKIDQVEPMVHPQHSFNAALLEYLDELEERVRQLEAEKEGRKP
jgi:hypothetical protein